MNTAKYGDDLCRNHSARSEKEFCRVCPSNLNKKELENVYFTLLESNLDLKTTINSQREKIKVLSTKVQRLTALQKTHLGKDPKECCSSKAVVNEQKECIAELRRSNQCLSERVRQLNMRLCSAKQFLKRSPFQTSSRCNRCSNKNVSMSALITKRSETNLRATAASSQYLVKDLMSSRTADNIVISREIGVQYDFCDENKCRTHIEELKNKNHDLQEELSKVKEKHALVTSQLERDVCDLRTQNVQVRSDRALAEDSLERLRRELAEVTSRLGSADLRCDELSVELAVEKRRAAELETQLKAADMSCRIASAIETHLTNVKMIRDHTNVIGDGEISVYKTSPTDENSKLLIVPSVYKPKVAVRTKIPHSVVDEAFKSSDDSGCTDMNKSQEVDDTKASTYINQILLEKIADLQNQINNLKASKNNNETSETNKPEEVNMDRAPIFISPPDKRHFVERVVSERLESVINEKKRNRIESGNDDNESKTQKTRQTNKPDEMYSEYENVKVGTQDTDNTTNRNSLELVESRNKVSRETNTFLDNRKLSLQNSREIIKDRNIVKTGSLDENAIIMNVKAAPRDRMKLFNATNRLTKDPNEKQVIKSSDHDVSNTEGLYISEKNQKYLKQLGTKSGKDVVIRNKPVDANEGKVIVEGDERKDSESSKGTYTIHKDENLNTKPKDVCTNIKDNKTFDHTTSYKVSYTLADDVRRVLNKATSKELLCRRRSVASDSRTYVKAPRDVSPNSTECEISSLSDLPSERDERTVCSRSPGEEKPLTASESRADTTTDYGSLSEGELPHLRDVTILSDGEKRLSNARGKSHSVPVSSARQMEETLAAVEQELTRCTRLLRSHAHRSLDAPSVN